MNTLKKIISFFVFVLSELSTLIYILLVPIKGKTHQERLESFYKNQYQNYDAFRQRLLRGREYLISKVNGKGLTRRLMQF